MTSPTGSTPTRTGLRADVVDPQVLEPESAQGGEPAGPALGRAVTHGALWSAVSTVFMRVTSLAVTALLARLLAPAEFGVFALALAVHVVVASLAELGMGSAIVRSETEPHDIAPTVTTLAIGVSGVLAVLMAWQAGPIAALVGAPDAETSIRILSLSLFLTGVFAVPGAQLVREFRQGRVFVATLIGFVPANLVLVGLALEGGGAEAFAWSRVVGQAVTGVVMVLSVRRLYRPGLDPRLVRGLLLFGLPLAGANLVNWTLLNADYVVLGRVLDEAAVGTYMIAFTVASWSTAILGAALNSVVVPSLARLGTRPEPLGRALLVGVRLVALVAVPVAATAAVLADPLVRTMFGESWAAAAPVMQILSGYGLLFAFSLLLSNALVATRRTGRLLVVQVLWLAALVPAMVLGAEYGLEGVAWAHLGVMVLVTLPAYAVAIAGATAGLTLTSLATAAGPGLVSGLLGATAGGAAAQLVAGDGGQFLLGGTVAVLVYLLLSARSWTAVAAGQRRGAPVEGVPA